MKRISKDMYYLKIAEAVLERSTCLRRKYGAVIVKNDEVIATGYNGSPRGEPNCIDIGICERDRLGVPKGERYELCVAVHAEQNAIISASRRDMVGSTIYIVGKEVATGEYADPTPCLICRKLIKNAGIFRCVGLINDEAVEIKI
jgi:dCMP deaminase